jgi:SAM-dependent methyltransferase
MARSEQRPTTASKRRRGLLRYGIEAPYVPLGLFLGALASVVLAVVLRSWSWLVVTVIFGVQVVVFLHTTLVGKHAVWREELDRLDLRGDERLLDLGCGSGAVLLAAASRLPCGTAEGVDLWRSRDQSGNDIEQARANATDLGVAGNVRLHTADLTDLPFEDGCFDVVTSALALHNIPTADGRRRAVEEAVRVLRPGGRLALVDVRHVKDYVAYADGSMIDVAHRGLGWRYWYGGPWAAAGIVTGRKP